MEKKMRVQPSAEETCYTVDINTWPITLTQQGPNDFTVTYGLQVKDELTYGEAAKELGRSIMHALACESRLDNSDATA